MRKETDSSWQASHQIAMPSAIDATHRILIRRGLPDKFSVEFRLSDAGWPVERWSESVVLASSSLPLSKENGHGLPREAPLAGTGSAPEIVSNVTILIRHLKHRRRIWLLGLMTAGLLLVALTGLPSTAFKELASRALNQHEPVRASNWLAWARRFRAADPEIEFLSARAARQKGDLDQLRKHIDRAWRLGYPVAILEREQLLALAQSGQMHEAEPALAGLLMNPRQEDGEICEAYATGFLRNYRLNDALRLVEAWVRDKPDNPRAWYLRATIEIEAEQWAGASESLQRVLATRPDHHEAQYYLGWVLLKQKQPEAALPWLVRAEHNPRFLDVAQVARIEALRMLGRYKDAKTLSGGLLKREPRQAAVLLAVGKLETDLGEYGDAVDHLEQACQLEPKSPDVRYGLAAALRAAGRGDEAKQHFQFSAHVRERLAHAQELQEVVAREPGNSAARCEIGTILLDYDQPERGLIWLHSALEYDPQFPAAHRRLADYYDERSMQSPELAALARKHRALAPPQ